MEIRWKDITLTPRRMTISERYDYVMLVNGEIWRDREINYYSSEITENGVTRAGARLTYSKDYSSRDEYIFERAYTYATWIDWGTSQFTQLQPVGGHTEGNTTIKIILFTNNRAAVPLRVVLLDRALPDNVEARYTTLMQMPSNSTIANIASGETEAEITIDATEIQKLAQYGIAIIPTKTYNYTDAGTASTSGDEKLYATFGYDDIETTRRYRNTAKPGVAAIMSPTNNSTIISNADTTIRWYYYNIFGEPAAFWSLTATNMETGEVTQIAHKQAVEVDSGETMEYVMEAYTLPAGVYKFNVAALPADAEDIYAENAPEWTINVDAPDGYTYTVKVNPGVSAIICDGKPVPTVSWTSSSQAAFQVRFGDYDSGARAGNDTSFTVPRIFVDGNYPVQVRTATDAGEWSDWTEIEYVEISNWVNDAIFDVTAERFEGNIKLSWTYTLNMEAFPDRYAIFRDGKLIGITGLRNYIDRHASAGTYTVYTMLDNQYLKSYPISVSFPPKYDVISANDGMTYTRLKYTPDMKSQPESHQTAVSFAWFAGRRKPVAMTSNQKTRVKQFGYIFHNRADAEFLIDLEGREVLLKNTRGAVIYGILSGLTISDERCPVVSFSIQEIEREGENVEYHV